MMDRKLFWVSTTHRRKSGQITIIRKPELSAFLAAFAYKTVPFGVTTPRFRPYYLIRLLTWLLGLDMAVSCCFHSCTCF